MSRPKNPTPITIRDLKHGDRRELLIKQIIAEIEVETGLKFEQIKQKYRNKIYTDAKSLICYHLHVRLMMGPSEIGRILCVDHTTVSHHLKRITGYCEIYRKYKWADSMKRANDNIYIHKSKVPESNYISPYVYPLTIMNTKCND